MSRLLLDSQVVVWWDLASPLLGAEARRRIQNATAVYVSAASEWELTIKAALGKMAPRRSILEAAVDAGFEPLAVTFEHAQGVGTLEPIHRDPFDRLLVAVALVERLALVSSDPVLEQYPIQFIDARG